MVNRVVSLVVVAVAASVLLVAGCGSEPASDDGEVRVVASTALLAEFAEIVAGDDAVVVGVIPAGVDPHSFEPSPAIAASIAQADLVLMNGHDLEETLLSVIEQNVADGVPVVAVSDGIDVLFAADEDADADGGEEEGVDPHLWLDARNAMHYVEAIRDALIEVAPDREGGYRERAAAYLAELQTLHDGLVEQLAVIPPEARQLVVFHDAYQYLAAAYGLEVLAAVLPASAQQDPAAGAIADLIKLIEEEGVRTVFAEPQFNAAVLERIAAEAGVEVGMLYSTYAGEVDTYVELMRANSEALRAGLAP